MISASEGILARVGEAAAPTDDAYATPLTRHARTPELQLRIVSEPAELAALGPDWNGLFERAGRPGNVFQTYAFIELFVRTHGYLESAGGGGRARLAILTARRAGCLVLVWPMSQQRALGITSLGWLGEPIAQYGDVLLDPAEDALHALQTAYDHIRATLRPDIMRLRKVRADAAIMPLFAHLGVTPTDAVEAPYVTLAAGGSAFEDRQSAKAKKNRRRLLRRLEERGSVVFEEVPATADVAARIAQGLADKREWLARRGLFSPALADGRLDQFMTAAATDAARATGYAVFTLSLDGRVIAYAHGFRCKRRLMLHLITYAADVEKCGAGVLNLEAILRLAEAEGLEAVDLLPPKAEYKLDWSDGAIDVADHAWGVSARGRLWAGTIERAVRPRLKSALEKLPYELRQRLSRRMLGHTPA